MIWAEYSELKELLQEKLGVSPLPAPKSLQAASGRDLQHCSVWLLAKVGDHHVAAHIIPKEGLPPSEIRRLCRAVISSGMAQSPCILTCEAGQHTGVFVSLSPDSESFQILDLVHPSPSDQDIIADIGGAKRKTGLYEKLEVAHQALDYEKLSANFFEAAKESVEQFEREICASLKINKSNVDHKRAASHYAIIIMARLVFIHFLEKKSLLNHDPLFVRDFTLGNLEKEKRPKNNLWVGFFKPLFEILSVKRGERRGRLLSEFDFPYLNGGLFKPYQLIEAVPGYKNLKISDDALRKFHSSCLYHYRLATSEENHQGEARGVLDPELLGTIFERFMKDDIAAETGSVYTPKDVVLYTVRNALTEFFKAKGLTEKAAFDLVHHHNLPAGIAEKADRALEELRLIDPCCGSGAFQLTALQALLDIAHVIRRAKGKTGWTSEDKRKTYEQILKNNIFGLDINPEAIILCHLRLWLPIVDLIDHSAGYDKIRSLPNLELNLREGNAVTNPEADWESPMWEAGDAKKAAKLREQFFTAEYTDTDKIKDQFDRIAQQAGGIVTLSRNFIDIRFGQTGGFDVVVGNPPYLGLKDTRALQYLIDYQATYEEDEKEISDLYVMVTRECYFMLNNAGTLGFVTSNTYFTHNLKTRFRKFLMGEEPTRPVRNLRLTYLSPKTFKVGVVPAIFQFQKTVGREKNGSIRVIAPSSPVPRSTSNAFITDFNEFPERYLERESSTFKHRITDVPKESVAKIPYSHFYFPSEYKEKFLRVRLNEWHQSFEALWPVFKAKEALEKKKNKTKSDNGELTAILNKLDQHRKSLRPGDLTLFGVTAEGGQGIASGCNAVHLYLLEGTPDAKWAANKIEEENAAIEAGRKSAAKIVESRKKVKAKARILERHGLKYAVADHDFPHKMIKPEEVLDVNRLDEKELEEIRLNGITSTIARKYKKPGARLLPYFVPYYKGQTGEDNRWLARVEYYIHWSAEYVSWMKQNSGKGFEGAPVIRNIGTFFKPSACWNLTRTYYLKSRLITKPGVRDVNCMAISSVTNNVSDHYITAVLNSNLFADLFEIISITSDTQIDDIRMAPLVIPSKEDHDAICHRVAMIVELRESKKDQSAAIARIEDEIEELVVKVWGLAIDNRRTAA